MMKLALKLVQIAVPRPVQCPLSKAPDAKRGGDFRRDNLWLVTMAPKSGSPLYPCSQGYLLSTVYLPSVIVSDAKSHYSGLSPLECNKSIRNHNTFGVFLHLKLTTLDLLQCFLPPASWLGDHIEAIN